MMFLVHTTLEKSHMLFIIEQMGEILKYAAK
jgi:hypothetical protein